MKHRADFLALLLFALAPAQPLPAIDAGGRANHGEEITVDLPDGQHLRNTGGRDGAGLCVFTSIDHAARYQNCQALIGFRDFMTRYPGGGWPDKVDQYIPKMAAAKGLPTPSYVQHTGGDVEFLKLALRTGRYPCITYDGRDGVFYRGRIAHMVNVVHISDAAWVIHDNNYPGKYLWMTPAEGEARWKGGGGGWAVVLLDPPPPPIPTSRPITRPTQPIRRADAAEEDMRALLLLTLVAQPALGQWGSNQCAPVRSAPPTTHHSPLTTHHSPLTTRHGWYAAADGKLDLYWHGERCGSLDPCAGRWHTAGKPEPVDLIETFALKRPNCKLCADCRCQNCPYDCTAQRIGRAAQFLQNGIDELEADGPPAADDPFPGGVVPERIPQAPAWVCNGAPCTRSQAFQALTAGGLVDDRDKPFLTIVGDEAMRRSVLADLDSNPALRGWKEKLHVAAYPPDHWCVQQINLQPGITYQRPPVQGNVAPVEWRFRAYAGALALAEALRKSDPHYRPEADPDPTRPPEPKPPPDQPSPAPGPAGPTPAGWQMPWHLLCVLGIGLLAVLGAYFYARR